jgi:hypothetical protein
MLFKLWKLDLLKVFCHIAFGFSFNKLLSEIISLIFEIK